MRKYPGIVEDVNCDEIEVRVFNKSNTMWSQNCLPFREHLSSPKVLNGVRLAQSLVFCVMFCR